MTRAPSLVIPIRNRDGLGWCIGLGPERKSGFWSRLPAKSTENFPNHHLAESQPSSDPAMADALGLEAHNRTVAWGGLGYRTVCGLSHRADQGLQSSRMQALLKAQGSCGVTERACQIVLIGVSGFVQRNQGIGFGGAILPGVVGGDDAMDENDALVPFFSCKTEASYLAGVAGHASGLRTDD
ncbi:MAG: hypothetical protein DMG30_12210 [Acidobacteria bacterium]|nr:MAG: hypothetical protein DMG30_12210 [Acidobacteriota bacterium]